MRRRVDVSNGWVPLERCVLLFPRARALTEGSSDSAASAAAQGAARPASSASMPPPSAQRQCGPACTGEAGLVRGWAIQAGGQL